MASTATTLAVVNLSLKMALIWSMAFLISLGVIGFAVVAAVKKRRNRVSSSTSSGINYDVFLSFRGPDTRTGFMDHLHSKLVDAGIHAFRDDRNLRAGEEIHPMLKEAIKGSKISIAIFSKDYASSRSCLMEAVQMWECRISNGQTIIPIFYGVTPDDVKRQSGYFRQSFDRHVADEVDNTETIKKWRRVLRKIGGISGWEHGKINERDESQLVKVVLKRVMEVLKKDYRVVTDKLVGIDLHVQEMMRKLGAVYRDDGQEIDVRGHDKRVVRIFGKPGVGKTTLAKLVYNKIHLLFDGYSFLEGINSEGIMVSQEKLIADLEKEERKPLSTSSEGIRTISSRFTNMKVLIVLDNVHTNKQIQALAGNLTWFGSGSRIIVIAHRNIVLNNFKDEPVEELEVKLMSDHHALQLFRKHAFQGDAARDYEYDSLSIDIVRALGGLPMAIVLRANYLKVRNDIEIWKGTRDSLNNHPEEEKVKAAINASYEGLHDHTREIFLDIACFFIGKDKRIPSYMWDACGYNSTTGIESLRDLHLLEVGANNELRMHILIREFGRDIVKRKDRFKRCRFWNHSEARFILKNRVCTESVRDISLSVKGIGLPCETGRPDCFTCEEFRNMERLSYLRLDKASIQGNAKNLPQDLMWLDWQECHFIPELCNLDLKELVILDLSRSLVAKYSQAWRQIMEKVKNLKVLNLQGCVRLQPSLDFPAPVNLEMLIMEDCSQLIEIHEFIRNLEKLSSLNLRKCDLKKLPEELYKMESLKELVIDGTGIKEINCQGGFLKNLETLSARKCNHLRHISTIGHLRNLSSLALDGADIDGLPDTFEFPQKLKRLSLKECRKLVKLPGSVGNLKLLEVMDLSDTVINEMPSSVQKLTELKTLKMARTHLKEFPKDIVKLAKLEEIDFSFCVSLKGRVCCDISKLSSLKILTLWSSNVAGLPPSICDLSCLQTLDIRDCNQLHALPKLPSSLLCLRWGSKNMRVPNLSYLTNLKELRLTDGEQPKAGWLMMLPNLMTPNIGWITRLPSLETLQLSLSKVTNLPRNFSDLTQLRKLSLSYMKKLDLTQLPSSSSLSTLRLKHCKIRKPQFSGLKHLSKLQLEHCDLAEIDGLEKLKLLEVLKISPRSRITDLSGLKDLGRLRRVKGDFSARPRLPKLSERVERDIYYPEA